MDSRDDILEAVQKGEEKIRLAKMLYADRALEVEAAIRRMEEARMELSEAIIWLKAVKDSTAPYPPGKLI